MSTRRKDLSNPKAAVIHPARPSEGPADMKAMYERTAKRFPKILAELAK